MRRSRDDRDRPDHRRGRVPRAAVRLRLEHRAQLQPPAPHRAAAAAAARPPPSAPRPPPPAARPPCAAAGRPSRRPIAAAGVPPPHPEPSQPTEEPHLRGADRHPRGRAERGDEADDDSRRLDLSANLEPRLVVESSPSLEVGRVIPLGAASPSAAPRPPSCRSRTSSSRTCTPASCAVARTTGCRTSGSTNGTFLNDRRIETDAQLKVHDALRIGQTLLRYEE